jgi:hypothetical protein
MNTKEDFLNTTQRTPKPGGHISAEVGVLSADPSGNTTMARAYWNSGPNSMVVGVPTEVRPMPNWEMFRLR